jgi:hypothetical protein
MQVYEYCASVSISKLDSMPAIYRKNWFQTNTSSLEAHKQAVGSVVDLGAAIIRISEPTDPTDQLYYGAKLEVGPLAAVRADPQVEMIECNQRFVQQACQQKCLDEQVPTTSQPCAGNVNTLMETTAFDRPFHGAV